MTNLSDLIRRMGAAGATPEAIAIAVEAIQGSDEKLEARRAADRQRKAKQRAASAESHVTVTGQSEGQTVTNRDNPEPLARVVYTSLPSLHSEEVITPISPNGEMPPLKENPGFARFWEAYPNKTGKGAAEKSYAKAVRLIGGPDPPGVLIAAVRRAEAGRQWQSGFVPNPATWLNQRRWEDQIEPPRTNVHELPTPDPKRVAREANLARAFAGSEMASGRRT